MNYNNIDKKPYLRTFLSKVRDKETKRNVEERKKRRREKSWK
jgi:hypothetical protein